MMTIRAAMALCCALCACTLPGGNGDTAVAPPWPMAMGPDLPFVSAFEGRVPCGRQDCEKLKVAVAFYGEGRPTAFWLGTVAVDGGNDRIETTGRVTTSRGLPGYPGAEVLSIDQAATAPLTARFWQVSPEVLLPLGEDGRPLPGDASFGMMLSRAQP